MKNIVFTGGGTAGHIMPNLAIIEHLKNYNVYYLGSNGMEKDIINKLPNITFIETPSVKFTRNLSPQNLLIPFKLIKNINKAKKILKEIKPSLIFSKGGYVSLPTCIAGNILDIPVITHESDLTIGLANKIIGKKAKYLCCSFRSTAEKYGKNAIFTGSPIRKKIIDGNKNKVITRHNLSTQKPIILVTGGSQGAQAINKIIWNNIEKLTKYYTIIHIVGKEKTNKSILSKDYVQIEFAQDIENYFDACNVVISRAGSNTIFELLAIKKPMILIPLPKSRHSRGDQELNAEYFKEKHFASVIHQDSLEINHLLETIRNTLNNANTYIQNMKNANNNVGNNRIIELIEKACL